MEKKLRITIPKEIYNLIENDLNDFGITKNYLCNYIFTHSDGFKKIYNYQYSKNKKIIQFSLNKKNKENYYSFLIEKKIQVEAEYFRNIFLHYAQQSKKSRELFVFKNIINKILYGIENKKKLVITFRDESEKKVSAYYFGSSELELKNYLFCYDDDKKELKNLAIRNIKSIFITSEKNYDGNTETIKEIIKNFDPFLSYNQKVIVKFTNKGLEMFNLMKTYRPKIIEKNNNVYTLRCSNLQAKKYFSSFWNEVEIIFPLDLRKWFKEKAQKIYEIYK